jgi:hypothetical protein
MKGLFETPQRDFTPLFVNSLPNEPTRGTITDHLTPIRPFELSLGMIPVTFNVTEIIEPRVWATTTIRACYQQISDTPQTLQLIDVTVEGDMADSKLGYLDPDREDLKIIWVLNEGAINRLKARSEDDAMLLALVVDPIAPGSSLKASNGVSSRISETTASGTSTSGMAGIAAHTKNEAAGFPILRALEMCHLRFEKLQGNTENISTDPSAIHTLMNRIQTHYMYLPIASTGGVKALLQFEARREIPSYNPQKQEFSHIHCVMFLPWACANFTQLAIQNVEQMLLALQTMQEILCVVWEKASEKIFKPWFDDLFDLFRNQSLTEGFRCLPIGILRNAIDGWVEKLFLSFKLREHRHLSMQAFIDIVRINIKIDVREIWRETNLAMQVIRAAQPISVANLPLAIQGYAYSSGLVAARDTNIDAAPSAAPPAGKRGRGKQDTQAALQLENKKLRQQLQANKQAQVPGTQPPAPAASRQVKLTTGNATLPPKSLAGVCVGRIAFLLKINPGDCKKPCNRSHIDFPATVDEPFRATLRGYVSHVSGAFRVQLDDKIAAL